VLVPTGVGSGGRYRHSGHAFGDQNGQVEHAEPDRDHEKPGIHLPGNPVETKEMIFHRDSTRTRQGKFMLQRNMTHTGLLQTFYEILLRRESRSSRLKTRRTPE
jgi:hypothetical protein